MGGPRSDMKQTRKLTQRSDPEEPEDRGCRGWPHSAQPPPRQSAPNTQPALKPHSPTSKGRPRTISKGEKAIDHC
ncbi:hypothetical protein PGT21_023495 [Puccinia graminis f. sp. tritici]|uniref:Uncharacterized protein n=1 Tax=Puccinia graminis f. sp. tritici TaxID=56615 RepID=A0A5B0QTU4_PUCGR|nr:hypothetical protein PGT21_023495 [Puccinia graminis f. sp. tritici]